MSLTARIRSLEPVARRLEPLPAERAALTEPVMSYANRFIDSLPTRPMFIDGSTDGAALRDEQFLENSADIADLLRVIETEVDTEGINPAGGGHLGYIPGG